ncbi:MAG TPA: hypothetical protein VIJ16_02425 [Gemmatimonadaceae bacterium]
MKASRLSFVALITCASTAVLISCSEQSPVGVNQHSTPAPSASLVGSLLQHTGLLACTPQPYDSATRIIGPGGGTIQVSGYTLSIPRGALTHRVRITAVAPTGTVNLVQFQPQGLIFQQSAQLTMSYANCGLLGALLPKHIAYTDNQLNILELLTGVTDLLHKTETAKIGHFSGYAVAY